MQWRGRCQTAIPSGTAEAPLDREELRIKSHMGRFSHPLRSFPASPGEPGRVSCAFCFPSFFCFCSLKIIPEGLAPEQVSLTDADYGLRGGEPEGRSQLRQFSGNERSLCVQMQRIGCRLGLTRRPGRCRCRNAGYSSAEFGSIPASAHRRVSLPGSVSLRYAKSIQAKRAVRARSHLNLAENASVRLRKRSVTSCFGYAPRSGFCDKCQRNLARRPMRDPLLYREAVP